MSALLLSAVLFVTWALIVLLPAGKLAIEDTLAGVPKHKRRGVSIVPGIPIFPLFFWGLAAVLDRFIGPWGTRFILYDHGLIFVVGLFAAVRSIVRLRRIEKVRTTKSW